MGKRACDGCHSKKIQCVVTDDQPICDWCAHHQLRCTFNRARGRKSARPRRPKYMKDVAERLRTLEEALARSTVLNQGSNASADNNTTYASTQPPTYPTPPAICSANTPPLPTSLEEQICQYELRQSAQLSPNSNATSTFDVGQLQFAGYHLGQISSHDGVPFFSSRGQEWIRSHTGEEALFQEITSFAAKHQIHPSSLSRPAPNVDLPQRALVETCLSIFDQCSFRRPFPLVDVVLFQDTIAAAYDPWTGPPSLQPVSSKACVFAFLSVSSFFKGGPKSPKFDSDDFALRAQSALFESLQDASLTTLQTLYMLCLQQAFSGRFESAAMFHAMACRIVFALGGHLTTKPVTLLESDVSIRKSKQVRALFWLCYSFDKDIAFRTGQPPLIADENCDLTLPDGYENQFRMGRLQHTPTEDGDALSPNPRDLRLTILASKAHRALYSTESLKKPDNELLRTIRELDAEVEAWRLSLSPMIRPSLSIPKNARLILGSDLEENMQRIIIHLEYHHLMATIHRASGRCHSWPSNPIPEGETLGVSVRSSLELSVEASRSTVFYLQAAIHELADEVFWIISFYPIFAVTTVFCNILLNPLNRQAKEDIELLGSAINLVKKLPVWRLSSHEIIHMKMVSDFISELIRLGNCAIAKAERERDTAATIGV